MGLLTQSPEGDFLMECQEKGLLLAQKVSFLGKRKNIVSCLEICYTYVKELLIVVCFFHSS